MLFTLDEFRCGGILCKLMRDSVSVVILSMFKKATEFISGGWVGGL